MTWPGLPTSDAATARPRRDLGLVALGLVATGPTLIVVGFLLSVSLGFLFALPMFAAAALAVPLACGGLVVGLIAAGTGSGRWKGLAAAVASLPAGALALSLAVPFIHWLTGSL